MRPSEVNSSYGGDVQVQWDGDDLPSGQTTPGEQDALIRFDNIFGEGPGQIPSGSVIVSATLTYEVFDLGNEANVFNVLVSNWSETTTWNSFGSIAGIQPDVDYVSSPQVAATTGSSAAGTKSVNVTSSLIAWATGTSSNYGWLFRPTGNSGVGFRSSEYSTPGSRPKLTVVYLADPPNLPVLVTPADNATGVSTSPTLAVTVSDPESRSLTVNYYGRPRPDAGEDFTIVALPDAQNYTAGLSSGTLAMFTAQTTWCVNNRAALNIVYVAMEGDITNDNDIYPIQWDNAVSAMSILESPDPNDSLRNFNWKP